MYLLPIRSRAVNTLLCTEQYVDHDPHQEERVPLPHIAHLQQPSKEKNTGIF